MTPPQPQGVTIERIGAEGDGVGRLSGGDPVYVPLTLPGESVLVEPRRPRGDGWLAHAVRIDAASDARVVPPCPAFGRCGGCVLQHWREADYVGWKRGLLEAALRRAGYEAVPDIAIVRGLPGERRRLDFAIRRDRNGVVIGLHEAGSAAVVDLAHCLVLHPDLAALLAPLRPVLAGLAAIRQEASLIVNLLDSGPDVLLRSDADPSQADRAALIAFARSHAVPRLSWARGSAAPEPICAFRPAATTLSGVVVRPPPGAFLQATQEGESAIVAAVLAGLPDRMTARSRIADLYAGCGTISFALARHARVAAFEGDAASVSALRDAVNQAALRDGVNQAALAGRVQVTARDLARQPLAAKELAPFAAVILDPPHGGAVPQVAQLAASTVPVVVYVSCNPATLGRDAAVLRQAGYHLSAVTAIDQFVWSARLEAVAVFHRR